MNSPSQEPNLVLVGFMGVGKSTVGRLLAQWVGRPFVDTDEAIEAETGLAVREIFARYGEPAFRRHERAACLRACRNMGQVIAVGGGALLDPANRAALEGSGVILLLTCRAPVLVERLRESARRGERPLLGQDVEQRVAALLRERQAVYSSVPLKIDTSQISPEEAARQALQTYRQAVRSRQDAGVA